MRISFIPPTEHEFNILFSHKPLHKGGGLSDINFFQPRQPSIPRKTRKGGGIFSFITKRVLPFIFRAAKPSAKEFVSSVVNDTIIGKRPIKQSIKKHGIKALKDTGLKLLSGSGKIIKKRKKTKTYFKKNINKINKKKKKKTINVKYRYKKDIFDMI